MRIVCPACSATYDVPNTLLAGSPRAVRCVRCSQEWTPLAELSAGPSLAAYMPPDDHAGPATPITAARESLAAPPAPAALPLAVALSELRAPLVPRQAAPGARAAILGWAATLVVLIGAGTAAYHWRAPIETAWPPIARAYAAIGLG